MMKITTCRSCGILIDQEIYDVRGYDHCYDVSGCIITDYHYDGEQFLATFSCPVCKAPVVTDHIL